MDENKRTYYDKDGKSYVFEEIMTFHVDEIGKTFLAYTVNDDNVSENIDVNLVEILNMDSDKPTFKKIDDEDINLVIEVFNSLLEQ